jgi:hypothetical protein
MDSKKVVMRNAIILLGIRLARNMFEIIIVALSVQHYPLKPV